MPSSTQINTVASGTGPEDALKLEQERLQRLSENPPQEIFVVSDFHLGLGRDPVTGRFSRTELFLADEAFSRFLDYCEPNEQKLLVINGDTFDFVRICNCPYRQEEFEEWRNLLAQSGLEKTSADLHFAITRKERVYGLQTDDFKSVWKLLKMAAGHGEFFRALAQWLNCGASLLLTKGNHDLELYWPLVRKAFLVLLQRYGAIPETLDRVFYCDNSILIGNVYLEHGHEYDSQQKIVGEATLPNAPSQLNLPVGIFVNRYLINRIEKLEPFLGAIRPNERILWLVLRRHPLSAITGLFSSLRFLRRALETSRAHNVFWYFIYSISVLLPFVTAILMAVSFFYFRAGNHFSVAKLFSLFGAGTLAPYLVAALKEAWNRFTQLWDLAPRLGEFLSKKLGRTRQPSPAGEDDMSRGVYKTIQTLKFPDASKLYAVMGHTHDQDIQRLPDLDGATTLYLNTGAWIPVWPDDRPDLDGQVLFPFVHFRRITPQEYCHEYLEWRDDRGEPAESYILEPPVD